MTWIDSSVGENGLTMYPYAPRSIAASARAGSSTPVTMIVAVSG